MPTVYVLHDPTAEFMTCLEEYPLRRAFLHLDFPAGPKLIPETATGIRDLRAEPLLIHLVLIVGVVTLLAIPLNAFTSHPMIHPIDILVHLIVLVCSIEMRDHQEENSSQDKIQEEGMKTEDTTNASRAPTAREDLKENHVPRGSLDMRGTRHDHRIESMGDILRGPSEWNETMVVPWVRTLKGSVTRSMPLVVM